MCPEDAKWQTCAGEDASIPKGSARQTILGPEEVKKSWPWKDQARAVLHPGA